MRITAPRRARPALSRVPSAWPLVKFRSLRARWLFGMRAQLGASRVRLNCDAASGAERSDSARDVAA
eukprot:182744-Pyramimonas_sp.AAC.1